MDELTWVEVMECLPLGCRLVDGEVRVLEEEVDRDRLKKLLRQ